MCHRFLFTYEMFRFSDAQWRTWMHHQYLRPVSPVQLGSSRRTADSLRAKLPNLDRKGEESLPSTQLSGFSSLSNPVFISPPALTALCRGWRGWTVSLRVKFSLDPGGVELFPHAALFPCRCCSDLPLGGVWWRRAEWSGSVWNRLDPSQSWKSIQEEKNEL